MEYVRSSCMFRSGSALQNTSNSEVLSRFDVNRLLKILCVLAVVLACHGIALAQVAVQTRVSTDQNSPSSTISSPAFSTSAANELLLAFISSDSAGSTNAAVNSVTGAGLTWVLVKRTNIEPGTTEIWRAFAPAVLSNVHVTASLSQSVVSSMTVLSFTGVATSGTNGSGAIGAVAGGDAQGAPAATLVTTHSGSFVVGVGNDYDNAIARTPMAGQTLLHQDLSSTGDTYWVQQINALAAAQGTTETLGDKAPTTDRYNLSICEVLPSGTNVITTPQLTLSASTLAFGNVNVNTVSTQTLTLQSSGTGAVTVSSAAVTGAGYSIQGATFPVTLNPGQTATLQVNFDPTAAGAASGKITVSSNSSSGSTATVTLSGTGISSQLAVSPSTLAFGNIAVNTTASQTLTLTSSGTAAVTINSATLTGTGFKMSGATFPAKLNAGQTMSLQVNFSPTAAGAVSGTIAINSTSTSGTSTTTVGLTGTGTSPVLTLSSTALSFGNDPVGTPTTLPVTLTSTGNAPVTVSSASMVGAGFSLSGATFPVTLNPTVAITLQVQFDPATTGAASGSLSLASNSSKGSPSIVTLNGDGTTAQHQVTLNWVAPVNSPVPVTGYHIYRATGSSSSYQMLDSSSSTSYLDLSVQANTAYSYYVTSVASSGSESTPSQAVSVTVP